MPQEHVKKLMNGFIKKLPDMRNFASFGLKKMKDMENTGNMIFQKYQNNTLDRKAKQKKFTWAMEKNKSTILQKLQNFKFHMSCANDEDKVDKYRELLRQEKQAFIEQSKIFSEAEIENKILKNHYRKALCNIRNELSKILTSDKSFQRYVAKINQSDSVHVNPHFGGSSGRLNAKSQNSFTHPNYELDVGEKDPIHSNFINLQNYYPLNNKNEISGFAGNNISGTTGGDDNPELKFNTIPKKVAEEKEISAQSLKRLTKLQELVVKYHKIPFRTIFNAQKHKFTNFNKEVNFNRTVSQDSINQAFTSFFGHSDVKENNIELNFFNSENYKFGKESKNSSDKELQKDSSFALLKDFEIGPHKEFELLKEIKEEIKEESLKRKQYNKKTLTLTFEDGTNENEDSNSNVNFNLKNQDAIYMNKTSPEPEMWFDEYEQKHNDHKYLSYVEQTHVKINSKTFDGLEPIENNSPSESSSGHRLRSSSSDNQSSWKIEENHGKLFVVKRIDEGKTVMIPQLDLDNIIQKQERKMYPFNINTRGEVIELTNKASSLDTHNDEDAIIIYDEQDQEESGESFKLNGNDDKKNSNLFNSSFFSDLSSVHKPKNKNDFQINAELEYDNLKNLNTANNKMILIDSGKDHSNQNSFLDQDLNIDCIPFENVSEGAFGFSIDEINGFEREDETSPFSGIQKVSYDNTKEVRQNNFMRSDSDENINNLNQFLNSSKMKFGKISRELNTNKLPSNDGKSKSVPAENRKIDRDHVTFGKESTEVLDHDETDYQAFEEILMKQDHTEDYDKDEETKIRNKSVVIPRSSILLKNKKNILKRNAEASYSSKERDSDSQVKNYSVSPSKIVFIPMKSNSNERPSEYENNRDTIKYTSLKHFNKAKINFKSGKHLKQDDSTNSINDSHQKKVGPFKFVKSKKSIPIQQIENYGSKSKLNLNKTTIVDNPRKSVPAGTKPVINMHKVKIIKSNMNQELKMKGRKLNLRFKDFTKNNPCKSKLRVQKFETEGKVNKSHYLQLKTSCEYENEL